MPPAVKTSKAQKANVKGGKLPTGAARDAQAKKDKALATQIVARRKADEKYGSIAADLKITVGKAIYLYECATTAPKDRITFTDEADRGRKFVAARAAGLSWGIISARSGVPEGTVRTAWEKATGKSAKGESIGKGGRSANGTPSRAKPKAAPKTKAAPKAKPAAPKAAAKPTGVKRVIKRRVAAS